MSEFLGPMTNPLPPKHGRYDSDLYNREEGVCHDCITKSGEQISDRNSDENNKQNNSRNNENDDDKGSHRHTS